VIRHLCLLLLLVLANTAAAQEPRVEVELESDSVVVGQPLLLRIRVLVPTWMPKPPAFPTLEVPSLMVRLPERASGPVSETIGGETWSGVQRGYRLYPLAPGDVQLPAGEVQITYAEPGQPDPIVYAAPLPGIRFAATLPEGARTLSPPILAEGFTLEQGIEGATDLSVGDAITRTLTARIEGTTPVLIPRLAEETQTPALRAYPKDPDVRETEDRSSLSGSRTETVTYIAQADGTVTLPALTLDWFNLRTNAVETASVPEILLTVTGAPPAPPDPAQLARIAALAAGALALLWGAYRWFRPAITGRVRELQARWQGSEHHAHRTVRTALARRDLSATIAALETWKTVAGPAGEDEFKRLETALAGIGAARFGPAPGTRATESWQALESAYTRTRASLKVAGRSGTARALPPLNP
jgi:hypothetical protein